jgi:hypothetical protein
MATGHWTSDHQLCCLVCRLLVVSSAGWFLRNATPETGPPRPLGFEYCPAFSAVTCAVGLRNATPSDIKLFSKGGVYEA